MPFLWQSPVVREVGGLQFCVVGCAASNYEVHFSVMKWACLYVKLNLLASVMRQVTLIEPFSHLRTAGV